MNPLRAVGDAARFGHRDEELKIDQIEAHRRFACLAFGIAEGCLRNLQIVPKRRSVNVPAMFDSLLTSDRRRLSGGRLRQGRPGARPADGVDGPARGSMPPAQAIAIVIVPAIVTNIWQTFGGPYLRDIIRRLWPLLIGTAAGIWLNAGALTGPYARYTTIALGLLLAINAVIGLSKFNFTSRPETRNGWAASSA